MQKAIGIRFKCAGKVYYFSPKDLIIKKGDKVIVETARGIEFGSCVTNLLELEDKDIVSPLKDVLRLATVEDIEVHKENIQKAKEAMRVCKEKIEDHNIDMKLVSTEYTFDNNKLIFYFTSDQRVDFRELVKDLAAVFKTRIELRQIGVRDEAKAIGTMGYCGRESCCSTFLCDFNPVTIKMAKDQSFSLNPSKISGICGRLMCCLAYEQEAYEYSLKKMPRIGSIVLTDVGEGIVSQISPLQEMVKIKFERDDEITEELISVDRIIKNNGMSKGFESDDL
ncbi:MAG: stage 0 sporulation family protein [Tissierellia bacterium]|nr:stage 0 sporulation family protein [Tissierellia bacterium]